MTSKTDKDSAPNPEGGDSRPARPSLGKITPLSTRITLGALLLILATSLILFFLLVRHERDAFLAESDLQLNQGLAVNGERLEKVIQRLRQDVLFLSRTPPIQGIIRASSNHGFDTLGSSSLARWKNRLQTIFSAVVETSSDYLQVRLIGVADQGLELVRVDLRDGRAVATPADHLQQKGGRGYFQATAKLQTGEVYLSEIDLNREHGKVAVPHVRTLRAGTPVYTPQGDLFGVVVINLNAGPFLDRFASGAPLGSQAYLMNDQGDYLVHPDAGKAFGFDLGRRHRWQADFPAVSTANNGHGLRVAASPNGPLHLATMRIAFDPDHPRRYLSLAYGVSDAHIDARIAQIRNLAAIATTVVAILIGTLFYLWVRRTLSPLRPLTAAALQVGSGRYDASLPEIEEGELGTLLTAFRSMQDRIGMREREITSINARLMYNARFADLIIDTAPEGILVADTAGLIVRVNKCLLESFGYAQDELLGEKVELLIPERLRTHHESLRRGFDKTGNRRAMGQERGVVGLHKQGHEIPLEAGLATLRHGDTQHIVVSLIDITQRKAVEERMALDREQQAALRELLEITLVSNPMADTLRHCLKRLLSVSWLSSQPRGGIFLKDAKRDILHLSVFHGLGPDVEAACAELPFGHCICGRAALTGEIQFSGHIDERLEKLFPGTPDHGHYSIPLTTDGRLLGVLLLYLPVGIRRDPLKEQFIASAGDILAGNISRTFSKRALQDYRENLELKVQERTAELEKSRLEAVRLSKVKDNFLANMSHELRTPLNAIIGYSEMLLEEAEDSGHQQYVADLGKVHGAGRHLLALISDILDLSKIEAGHMEIHVEAIDVAAMIQDIADTVEPLARQNDDKVEVSVTDDIGELHADALKVRQILFNLLSNAAKFTHDGLIRVSAMRRESAAESRILFLVEDSGIGMDEEQAGRIFNAFVQADSSTTRKYGGTGLGLAITKRFCEMMGGDIQVDSSPGEGTRFTVNLPSRVEARPQSGFVQTADGEVTPPATVPPEERAEDAMIALVVEDDPNARDLLRRQLEQQGFAVVTATGGVEGLELAKKQRPQLITLDIMMPDLDGWSVLRQLKQDPATADIPVAVCSILDDRTRGLDLGAAEYLVKPASSQEITQVLGKYGGGHGDCRILVVEDDENARGLLVRRLAGAGYRTDMAADGQAALEHMAKRTPDLILLDLMMPNLDGFGFIREMRRVDAWRQIPIVVVTAKALTSDERDFLGRSAFCVVEKGEPLQGELLQRVKVALEQGLSNGEEDTTALMAG